jgi:hypothetical protein
MQFAFSNQRFFLHERVQKVLPVLTESFSCHLQERPEAQRSFYRVARGAQIDP